MYVYVEAVEIVEMYTKLYILYGRFISRVGIGAVLRFIRGLLWGCKMKQQLGCDGLYPLNLNPTPRWSSKP